MFDLYINLFSNPSVVLTFKVLYYTGFVWVPLLLGWALFNLWVDYRRAQFMAKQTHILLEIKLPRDIFKSPRAMEFFINGLSQPFGEGNWYLKWWQGSIRPWFSLEMVSLEGSIHFFIWTRKGYRNQIEANLYSQYPGIEIYEVPDYTLPVSFDPETTGLFASEYALTKADVFPIKTYIDYGMDKDPKEEYKIDPLTPLIEYLGTLGKGHQAWVQILVRTHLKEEKDPKTGEAADLRWAKAAKVEIDKIHASAKGEKDKEDKLIPGTGRMMTRGEGDVVAALERSISKTGFDVGIRSIYIAPKDIFNGSNIGGIIGGITHFNSNDLNGFKPNLAGGKYAALRYEFFPWKRWKSGGVNAEKLQMLEAYKRRAYFIKPFKSPHFVLNTEELATIFHFPGGVATTPTFERIGSKKAEAPSNLPS